MAKFLFYDDKIINILLQDEKPSGGAAIQAYGWIRGLLAAGHEVYLMTEPVDRELIKKDCQDIKIIPDYNPSKGIRWIRWVYYRLPFIYGALKKHKPDYIYKGIPSWHSFLLGVICHILNIKFIQRVSNDFLIDDRFFLKYSKSHRLFQDFGFKLSDYILCQNDYQLKLIAKKFPDKTNLKISNPIILKSSTDLNSIGSRSYIAWLGLFQYQKNLKLLYQIASLMHNEQFVVAGKAIPKIDEETLYYLNELQELPNVKLIGFLTRQQVLPFLADAKFLLNTSHYEGFSNTFLEAMAVGTPILSSDLVNPDSIITKNNLGIVYKDAHDLHTQYCSLQADDYQIMSSNAYKHVFQNHDYRQLTQDLTNILNVN
ncbi:glycosyltransferase family 4 protein [Pontibacter sp. JH31]|uniref:Glycosyltransferase family 4 protein n=2 Tax=Pontibacter aquaedesilientis TaxID=2766980 RepID=A0ABR7XHH5_9BACT|nr:glycosyltransferase family 4 protein [Pontibacter aquaedesilientis]